MANITADKKWIKFQINKFTIDQNIQIPDYSIELLPTRNLKNYVLVKVYEISRTKEICLGYASYGTQRLLQFKIDCYNIKSKKLNRSSGFVTTNHRTVSSAQPIQYIHVWEIPAGVNPEAKKG